MMIKERAGTDVTGEFDEIHSRNAWKILEGLKIGVVGKQPRNNLGLPNAAPPKAISGGIGIPDNVVNLKVVSREAIDEDHICLRLDGDLRWSLGVGQHVFSWKAGSSRNDDAIARPYTPLDASRSSIRLLVKRYPYGRMSEHLHDESLREISVTGPSGKPLEPYLTSAAGPVVMFAAGTGIAPFFRCLRHSLTTGCQCVLVWSFRGSPVPLLEELAGFQLRSRQNQFLFGFLGEDFKSPADVAHKPKGGVKPDSRLCGARLQRSHVACAIRPGAGFTEEPACAFVCGPPAYHADVNSMLKAEGFKGQIHELG
jgi:NAD(P)H-flavin reductase